MGTFEALLVIAVTVLPGAMYMWTFERQVGGWGAGASDRIYRFVGVSAILLSLGAYPAYLFYGSYLHRPVSVDGGIRFVNLIASGGPLPWWVFGLPLLYLAASGFPNGPTDLYLERVYRMREDGSS